MIEKVGHSKRMQVMRKQWIDEGKPRNRLADYEDNTEGTREKHNSSTTVPQNGPINQNSDTQSTEVRKTGEPPVRRIEAGGEESLFVTDDEAENHDMQPEEDELDALLAEDAAKSIFGNGIAKQTKPPEKPQVESRDEFADEMEAMEGMDHEW